MVKKCEEPLEIKELANKNPNFKCFIALHPAYGLPHYLWSSCKWKDFGIKWNDFLHILSLEKEVIKKWLNDELSWYDLVSILLNKLSQRIEQKTLMDTF